MGQYHFTVNLDKEEFVDPHKIGCGLKLWEQLANHPSTGTALIVLTAVSNGHGGGDLAVDDAIGRWGGDHIAIVGDYGEEELEVGNCVYTAAKIYEMCSLGEWTDISYLVTAVIERNLRGHYEGEGWMSWKPD